MVRIVHVREHEPTIVQWAFKQRIATRSDACVSARLPSPTRPSTLAVLPVSLMAHERGTLCPSHLDFRSRDDMWQGLARPR